MNKMVARRGYLNIKEYYWQILRVGQIRNQLNEVLVVRF